MSDGEVCTCQHYKEHHSLGGRCLWEWHGKTCDCRAFTEDQRMGEARQRFLDAFKSKD